MRGFALVAVGILMAGCVAGEEARESDSQPFQPGDLDPNSEFGAIQGALVTDEAMPIPGAQVALQGIDKATTTDAAGLFVLRDVPPGTYTLFVGALGYEAAAKTIEVRAGEVVSATVVLVAIQVSGSAFSEVFHFTGFFECAAAVPGWVSACSYPYTALYLTARDQGVNLSQYGAPSDVQPNSHRFNFTIRQGIAQFVGEMTWQPTSAAATEMRLNMKCGDYHPVWDDCVYPYAVEGESIRYGEAVGVNPLRVVIDADEFYEGGKGKGKWDLHTNPSIWIMNYVSLPHGTEQVAFQQRFDVWDTVFYNAEGPEGYTILADA